MKYSIILSLLFSPAFAVAQTERTICESDVKQAYAVFGGDATCVGKIDAPFGAKPLPNGWPQLVLLSRNVPDILIEAVPDFFPGHYRYKTPSQVYVQGIYSERCLLETIKCDTSGSCGTPKIKPSCGLSVGYQCYADVPYKGIVEKVVKKGECKSVPIKIERVITRVIYDTPTNPGCVVTKGAVNGLASSYTVSCQNEGSFTYTKISPPYGNYGCDIHANTVGYSITGNCYDFELNKTFN